jgi:hypothetical protein
MWVLPTDFQENKLGGNDLQYVSLLAYWCILGPKFTTWPGNQKSTVRVDVLLLPSD